LLIDVATACHLMGLLFIFMHYESKTDFSLSLLHKPPLWC